MARLRLWSSASGCSSTDPSSVGRIRHPANIWMSFAIWPVRRKSSDMSDITGMVEFRRSRCPASDLANSTRHGLD